MERTLVLIKPDAIARRLTGLCLHYFENAGLEIVGARVVHVTPKLARTHYKHLKDKPFFNDLIHEMCGEVYHISSNRVFAFVLSGENAIARTREITGATNPMTSAPGTVRNAFGRIRDGRIENAVHASGSRADYEREVKLWFPKGGILK